MAVFLMIFYRGTLNAFLAVKIVSFPIDSYDDILKIEENVIVWKGTVWEAQYKQASQGSLFREIYEAKVQHQPGLVELGGTDKVLDLVSKGEAIYSGTMIPLYKSRFYPCLVQPVPNLM